MLKRILFLAGLVLASTSVNAAIYSTSPIRKTADQGSVPTNAALQSLKSTDFTFVTRRGFYTSDDSPRVAFTSTNAACSLNSGNGDNGTQVKLADGNCATASLQSVSLTPTIWGAKGDGATDDTAAVQAAINAASAAGLTLNFDGSHLYKITATLNITSPLRIEGQYRYGIWTTNAAGTGVSCPWGLMTPNTGITMINASAVTGSIKGLCIDMTGNDNNSATAGTAIQLAPPSATTYQTGFHVELNTILAPYLGITLDGFGYSPNCCGQGATADGNAILRNTIVNPANAGIRVGFNTAGSESPGNTLTDNDIVCKNAASKATGIGVALYDGGVWYDGTQNGPEGCHVGVLIAPGSVTGHGQLMSFNGDGAFGDQSGLHDLWIAPTAGGVIWPAIFAGKGAWAGASVNVNSVLVDCTAANTQCYEFTFNGVIFHAGNGSTVPIMDIEAGLGGPYDVTIANSSFCQSGTPGAGAMGLKLNAGSGGTGRWVVNGNRFGPCAGGTLPTAISLTINSGSSANGSVTIVGNDMSANSTPIAYTPNQNTDNVIIHDNMGIDNVSVGTAAVTGSTTSLALPANFIPVIGIPGSGNPTISSLTAPTAYPNRQIELINAEGGTITFSPGTGICNSASLPVNSMLIGRWSASGACYNLH